MAPRSCSARYGNPRIRLKFVRRYSYLDLSPYHFTCEAVMVPSGHVTSTECVWVTPFSGACGVKSFHALSSIGR